MNDENLTADISKAIDRDLKAPPRVGNGSPPANKLDETHRQRIDHLIAEFQMTIRILEEAKRRL